MREVKFRAWDKENNRMLGPWVVPDLPIIDDDGMMISHKWEKGRAGLLKIVSYVNDLIWIEYTGLKDRHGKEIYEEDIVCLSYQTSRSIKEVGRVFWSGQGWDIGPQMENNPAGRLGGKWQEFIEVIGNI